MRYQLKLAANPSGWRLFAIRKSDPKFQKFSQKIWERDDYTCQFCGFQAKQHQEVINLDQNYQNNKMANMATACCFCTQCFFLESVGKTEYSGGLLIYLPEISQNQLNALCHVLFCAMGNANDYQTDAQDIYRTLNLRSKIIDKILGEGMSNPVLLGQMIIDVNLPDKEQTANKILNDIRLLPTRERFDKQISDWAQSAFSEMSTNLES
jgi:intracellular multiplication protein IcmJ